MCCNYLFIKYLFINLLIVITNEDTIAIFDSMDDYFLYMYCIEFAIKIIGLGFEKYWEDDWNKFDFGMIILSVASSLLY